MASITIDPANLCVRLVCGSGESDVSFTVAAIYKAWKDWFVLSDNSKYTPTFDSAGGDPAGTSSLDNVYFLKTVEGWRICPQTVEPEVIIRLDGNLFPAVPGDPLFEYDYVVSGGKTHIETTVSTSARTIETGTSGLTVLESAALLAIQSAVAAYLDAAVSSRLAGAAYNPLTAQNIRDAMQLAPSGSTSANSVDDKLDKVKTNTNLIPALL